MPRRVSGGRPVYSQAALFAQVEGLVFLEVLVGVDGTVRDARVTNSQVPLLDQSALDAVVQWRFEPTLVNGVPRDVSFVVGINFSLRDGQR